MLNCCTCLLVACKTMITSIVTCTKGRNRTRKRVAAFCAWNKSSVDSCSAAAMEPTAYTLAANELNKKPNQWWILVLHISNFIAFRLLAPFISHTHEATSCTQSLQMYYLFLLLTSLVRRFSRSTSNAQTHTIFVFRVFISFLCFVLAGSQLLCEPVASIRRSFDDQRRRCRLAKYIY